MTNLDTETGAGAHPLLHKLSLEEKISLLSGNKFNATPGIHRLGIPPIKVSDSINGIRPFDPLGDLTTACFPSTTCLASTWDVELLGRLGEQLAHQARMKSSQVVLGPTINIHRDPRGGRNFECFSEDPLMSGQLAGAIVNGIQKHGVGACPKHFVCNDSETLRHYYNVAESVNGRALREIYLAAWQHLLRVSDPVGVMMAYNKVDGDFCTESQSLIAQVLRGTWRFRGVTMSDWFATHSVVPPIKAGMDLEMPFPVVRGPRLLEAVRSGDVTEEELDHRVARLLLLRDRTKASHQDEPEKSEISEEANRLARDLASSGIVLLKNDGEVLPLDTSRALRVAVIGEFGTTPPVTGGGSASCKPQYTQNPFDLLQEILRADNPGSLVSYARGVRTRALVPVAPTALLQSASGRNGVDVAYYNATSPTPVLNEFLASPHVSMLGPPFKPGLAVPGSHLVLTTTLTPATTGTHTLAVRSSGTFSLVVDGAPVLSGAEPRLTTEQFIFNHKLYEFRAPMFMEAGRPYVVRLTVSSRAELMAAGEPTPYMATLCFEEANSDSDAIAEAAALAASSDLAVVFCGRGAEHESEGFDLVDTKLPGRQEDMVRAVAAVAKKTVVVVYCGNPVDVEGFVDGVDGVVNAHFPGQEGGRALVDVLTGRVNPSGRLATTWFKGLEACPSFGWFPAERGEDGEVRIRYGEGVGVGYRADGAAERVRWPFGFGLSYTEFEYFGLEAVVEQGEGDPVLICSVGIRNAGTKDGRDAVQLYVVPEKRYTLAWRPERELKAFAKVSLRPEEATRVELKVDLKVACSYWHEDGECWRMENGEYGVRVGNLEKKFDVAEPLVWNHL